MLRYSKAHHRGRALVLIPTNHCVITEQAKCVWLVLLSLYEDVSLVLKSLKELGSFGYAFCFFLFLFISKLDIAFAFRDFDNVSRNTECTHHTDDG